MVCCVPIGQPSSAPTPSRPIHLTSTMPHRVIESASSIVPALPPDSEDSENSEDSGDFSGDEDDEDYICEDCQEYKDFSGDEDDEDYTSDDDDGSLVNPEDGALISKLRERNCALFTRDLLLDAATKLEKAQHQLRSGGPMNFDTVYAPDIEGNLYEILNRDDNGSTDGIRLVWAKWRKVAKASAGHGAQVPLFRFDDPWYGCLDEREVRITAAKMLKPGEAEAAAEVMRRLRPSKEVKEAILDLRALYGERVAPNEEREHLEELLMEELGFRGHKNLVRIDNIVCVGLGTMNNAARKGSVNKSCLGWSAHQHVVVSWLSRYLSSQYSEHTSEPPKHTDEPSKPIPIYSFDPLYTAFDQQLTARLDPPITILSDPYHFLAITRNTLLVHMAAPITQSIFDIVADIMHDSSGVPTAMSGEPAAILTNDVLEDPKVFTPPVQRMLRQYNKTDLIGWMEKYNAEQPDGWTNSGEHCLYTRQNKPSNFAGDLGQSFVWAIKPLWRGRLSSVLGVCTEIALAGHIAEMPWFSLKTDDVCAWRCLL